jgi:2-hydroxychromene-2-carboxylate isomerase
MGELIVLAHHRPAAAPRPEPAPDASFYFDLACPFSYLAAEATERLLGHVAWVPVARSALLGGGTPRRLADVRAAAERRALQMRLSLSWPEDFETGFPQAMRAAAYAAETGAGSRFALAAMRLAFCGGFDLDHPCAVADAAAAGRLDVKACVAAMEDPQHDELLYDAAVELSAAGVRDLPAVDVDGRWFGGEAAVAQAVAFRRAGAVRPAVAGASGA